MVIVKKEPESSDVLQRLLREWQLFFVPSSLESSMLAGEHFAGYLRRGGASRRVLADFLIGAHAQVHADRLIARDRRYLRDYFRRLETLDPSHTV